MNKGFPENKSLPNPALDGEQQQKQKPHEQEEPKEKGKEKTKE